MLYPELSNRAVEAELPAVTEDSVDEVIAQLREVRTRNRGRFHCTLYLVIFTYTRSLMRDVARWSIDRRHFGEAWREAWGEA